MSITTPTSYKLPASVAMQASLMTDFVALHRFPEQFSVTNAVMAAGARVVLITGIAEFRIVVLNILIANDPANNGTFLDNTTIWLTVRTAGIDTKQFDFMPYGKVLGNGANLHYDNNTAGVVLTNITVFYTFERN